MVCLCFICTCLCVCAHVLACVQYVWVYVCECSCLQLCVHVYESVVCVNACASVGMCLYVCWSLRRIFLNHSWNCVPSTGLWVCMASLSFYLGAADLNSASNAETELFLTPRKVRNASHWDSNEVSCLLNRLIVCNVLSLVPTLLCAVNKTRPED